MKNNKYLILFIILVIFSACAKKQEQLSSPAATQTFAPLTEEEQETVLLYYKSMVKIYLASFMQYEINTNIEAEKYSVIDAAAFLSAVNDIIDSTTKSLPDDPPHAIMTSYWTDSLFIHEATKFLANYLVENYEETGEMDYAYVVEQANINFDQMDKILTEFEELLSANSGFDAEAMKQSRQDSSVELRALWE